MMHKKQATDTKSKQRIGKEKRGIVDRLTKPVFRFRQPSYIGSSQSGKSATGTDLQQLAVATWLLGVESYQARPLEGKRDA